MAVLPTGGLFSRKDKKGGKENNKLENGNEYDSETNKENRGADLNGSNGTGGETDQLNTSGESESTKSPKDKKDKSKVCT